MRRTARATTTGEPEGAFAAEPDEGAAPIDDELPDDEQEHDSFLRAAAATGAEDELTIGTLVQDYRIVGLLGRGGMGIVYRAHDEASGRSVALKLLPRSGMDTEGRRRFVREARLAAAMKHPNVAAVYAAADEGEHVWLAMELVEGVSLRATIAAGPLGTEVAVRIGSGIASALAHAHARGVIHRDLKPDNVMIDADGCVKVLDFGIAKAQATQVADPADAITESVETHHATRTGTILGTPAYMSPEQGKGHTVDDRTDVFSFGVTLFEMLTGRRPFRGTTPMEMIIAIDRDPAPAASSFVATVPAAIDELIAACLAKAPGARPTMSEVRARLETLATGLDPEPRRRAPSKRLWLVAAATLMLVGAGAVVFRLRGAEHAATAASPGIAPLAGDAALACPILDASGVAAPAGWFGAAAADLVCRRAKPRLGVGGALSPAVLLGLSRAPGGSLPDDPFVEADARARSIAAAKRRATAHVDGRIVAHAGAFEASLELRDSSNAVAAHATGHGATLEGAIGQAADALFAAGKLGHDAPPSFAAEDAAELDALRTLATSGGPDAVDARRTLRALSPASPTVWTLGRESTAETELTMRRRAATLAPRDAGHAARLGEALVKLGRFEEARALATTWSADDASDRGVGAFVNAALDVREGRPARALQGYERTLAETRNGEVFSRAGYGALLLAEAMGAARGFADRWPARFVSADRPVLAGEDVLLHGFICARAGAAIARACAASLRKATGSDAPLQRVLLDGLERLAAGDGAGATAAWSPLAGTHLFALPASVFEDARAVDFAARIDAAVIAEVGESTPSFAHVRSARRALARGDLPRAQSLARVMADGWSSSDVRVPYVSDMKAILALRKKPGSPPAPTGTTVAPSGSASSGQHPPPASAAPSASVKALAGSVAGEVPY